MAVLVTGGAGFIGANFVLSWLRNGEESIVNIDKLTYAGNLMSLDSVSDDPRHVFVHGDIADAATISNALQTHQPTAIVHFAAESHVDRSIHGPDDFVQTNIVGTFRLLEEARAYFASLSGAARDAFRFVNVSTDEVYGSLEPEDDPFHESTNYRPNSPYAATKAAADHLARSYFHTYGLPVMTTNCSNNYGPYQFPEKLIPLMILSARRRQPLPIYGDGLNVRDWLYVEDHCAAIRRVLEDGRPGETYNIGGNSELTNVQVVEELCALLDEMTDTAEADSHRQLITYVEDRPGHDRRYAINPDKISTELNWRPQETFRSGLKKTVQWYLDNEDWISAVESGEHRKWLEKNYSNRAKAL